MTEYRELSLDNSENRLLSRRKWISGLSTATLAAIAGSSSASAQQKPSGRNSNGASFFNVRDFGAAGDGKTLDTIAIQSAIDACANHGGGTVLLPAGSFLTGTIQLRSHVTLHIAEGSTLLGSSDLRHYHAAVQVPLEGDATLNDGNWGLIYAVEQQHIALEGRGTIYGHGEAFRAPLGDPAPNGGYSINDRRPFILLAYKCEGLQVRNLDLIEAGYHCLRIVQCNRVMMDGLYIHNRLGANKDGFHFISCQFVSVSNSTVLANDDACALFGSCQNVTVTNCFFSTRWSVFRFGGGHVRNIVVTNCVLSEVYGCPIKLQGNEGSTYENLSFSNLIFDRVTGPIHVGVGPGAAIVEQEGQDAKPLADVDLATGALPGTKTPATLRNFTCSHLSGTIVTDPPEAADNHLFPGERHQGIVFNCVGGATMEDISLSDVQLTFGGGGTASEAARRSLPEVASEYFQLGSPPAYGIFARGVHGFNVSNVRFKVASPDLRPAIVLQSVTDASIQDLSAQGNTQSEAVIRARDCSALLISSPRVLTPSGPFLQVEGKHTGRITVEGGDTSNATKRVVTDTSETLSRVVDR